MNSAMNPRIENLAYTCKELQNEKVGLEQKLQELDMKRHALEQELDQETGRRAHIQEKHRRMSAIFAIGRQKVDSTTSTCISLQAELDRKKPQMHKRMDMLKAEKKLQREKLKKFECELSTISEELFHAKDFYKKLSLLNEINDGKKKTKEYELRAQNEKREIYQMSCKFEQLKCQREACFTHNFGCEKTLQAIVRAMTRDRQETEEYRNRVRAELLEIQNVLNAEN